MSDCLISADIFLLTGIKATLAQRVCVLLSFTINLSYDPESNAANIRSRESYKLITHKIKQYTHYLKLGIQGAKPQFTMSELYAQYQRCSFSAQAHTVQNTHGTQTSLH